MTLKETLDKITEILRCIQYAQQTKEELANSLWQGPQTSQDWFENNQPISITQNGYRWIQYRLALGAINGLRTPRITTVELTYEY